MCALSHHIREEPNWWEKVKDETAVQKWRVDALQREKEGDKEPSRGLNFLRKLASARKLTSSMVRLCNLWTPPLL